MKQQYMFASDSFKGFSILEGKCTKCQMPHRYGNRMFKGKLIHVARPDRGIYRIGDEREFEVWDKCESGDADLLDYVYDSYEELLKHHFSAMLTNTNV